MWEELPAVATPTRTGILWNHDMTTTTTTRESREDGQTWAMMTNDWLVALTATTAMAPTTIVTMPMVTALHQSTVTTISPPSTPPSITTNNSIPWQKNIVESRILLSPSSPPPPQLLQQPLPKSPPPQSPPPPPPPPPPPQQQQQQPDIAVDKLQQQQQQTCLAYVNRETRELVQVISPQTTTMKDLGAVFRRQQKEPLELVRGVLHVANEQVEQHDKESDESTRTKTRSYRVFQIDEKNTTPIDKKELPDFRALARQRRDKDLNEDAPAASASRPMDLVKILQAAHQAWKKQQPEATTTTTNQDSLQTFGAKSSRVSNSMPTKEPHNNNCADVIIISDEDDSDSRHSQSQNNKMTIDEGSRIQPIELDNATTISEPASLQSPHCHDKDVNYPKQNRNEPIASTARNDEDDNAKPKRCKAKKLKQQILHDAPGFVHPASSSPQRPLLRHIQFPTYVTPSPALLKLAYNGACQILAPADQEDFGPVSVAQQYYDYWKPTGCINVILLAESHVFTPTTTATTATAAPSCNNHRLGSSTCPQMKLGPQLRADLAEKLGYKGPRDYVSLVYCLGYGERDCLTTSPMANAEKEDKVNTSKKPSTACPIYDTAARVGTPQFWSLLAACLGQDTKQFNKGAVSSIQAKQKRAARQKKQDKKRPGPKYSSAAPRAKRRSGVTTTTTVTKESNCTIGDSSADGVGSKEQRANQSNTSVGNDEQSIKQIQVSLFEDAQNINDQPASSSPTNNDNGSQEETTTHHNCNENSSDESQLPPHPQSLPPPEATTTGQEETAVEMSERLLLERMKQKLELLQALKDAGIWLLDTSILGWYRTQEQEYTISKESLTVHKVRYCRPPPPLKAPTLVLSWELYMKHVIREAVDKFGLQLLIPIGREVEKAITKERLEEACRSSSAGRGARVVDAFPAPNAWCKGGYGPVLEDIRALVAQHLKQEEPQKVANESSPS